jgi:hypothetical protein
MQILSKKKKIIGLIFFFFQFYKQILQKIKNFVRNTITVISYSFTN